MGTEDIKDIPFVISKKPVINGATKEDGILITLKLGEIIKKESKYYYKPNIRDSYLKI